MEPKPSLRRRRVIGVVGNNRADAALERAARAVGRAIVDAGFRLVTGGLGGVMAAASRGAHESPRWREGHVIGVLPGADAAAANPFVDVAIPTGLGAARNTVVVATADAVIAVGGGSGTLSEIACAWQPGRPIVALDLDQGWRHALAGRRPDDRRHDAILRATDPAEAVALARAALKGAPLG